MEISEALLESNSRHIEYLNKPLYDKIHEEESKKIPKSYILNLTVYRRYIKEGGKVKITGPGGKPSPTDVNKRIKQEHENKIKNKSKGAELDLIEEILGIENMTPITKLNTKLTEIFASMAGVPTEVKSNPTNDDISNLHNRIDWLSTRLSNHQNDDWNWRDQHQKGHLPPASSPGQMNSVLKKLGMDKDYQAQPRTIYASDGSVKEIIVTFTPKK